MPGTASAKFDVEVDGDELVGLGRRPGRKAATIVHAMVAGDACIDDVDILRAGATGRLVGHEAVAPSTVGTWLRRFTFGHVRQLDRFAESLLARAWAAGAGPGDKRLVIDVDSTVCEVHGYAKQGAAFGYTRPAWAASDAGHESGHRRGAARPTAHRIGEHRQRPRRGSSARRSRESFACRAGATGQITLRADSGYWSRKVIAACHAHGVRFSRTVRTARSVRVVGRNWAGASGAAAAPEELADDRRRHLPRQRR